MASGDQTQPNLSGVVALVVDDDPDTREIFSTVLALAGASVDVAASARAAFALVKTRVPDVVITDMSMPGEDGVWLLSQIRGHSREAAQVPVVVVTGHGRDYARDRMLEVGFERYMTKPVDPWQLCTTVYELAHLRC